MGFKISDLIWTVIIFGLFILVVNGLLISPMLKFMDARRERIEKAKGLKAAREEAERLASIEAEKQKEEEERLRLERENEELRRAEEAGREELKAFQAELEEKERAAAIELEALTKETDAKLLKGMDAMMEAFTQKLISGRQG